MSDAQLARMRDDWDRRARENARHYIATGKETWTDAEFFASGERTVADQILSDMGNVCRGKDPREMRVLEIGCGAGRITRALAGLFGEVHGVDISGRMIEQARAALSDLPNAFVYRNNGMDFSVVPDLPFDFVFSIYVFQHIPDVAVMESYIRDAARLLAPGALLKFQAQGRADILPASGDTWVGAPLSEDRAREVATCSGFDFRYSRGAGTEEFWLWFFRQS